MREACTEENQQNDDHYSHFVHRPISAQTSVVRAVCFFIRIVAGEGGRTTVSIDSIVPPRTLLRSRFRTDTYPAAETWSHQQKPMVSVIQPDSRQSGKRNTV